MYLKLINGKCNFLASKAKEGLVKIPLPSFRPLSFPGSTDGFVEDNDGLLSLHDISWKRRLN